MDGSGWGNMGRMLVGIGLALAAFGALLLLVERLTGGKGLPGDVAWQRGNVRVYLPIASSILLSLVLTIALNLLARWWRR